MNIENIKNQILIDNLLNTEKLPKSIFSKDNCLYKTFIEMPNYERKFLIKCEVKNFHKYQKALNLLKEQNFNYVKFNYFIYNNNICFEWIFDTFKFNEYTILQFVKDNLRLIVNYGETE